MMKSIRFNETVEFVVELFSAFICGYRTLSLSCPKYDLYINRDNKNNNHLKIWITNPLNRCIGMIRQFNVNWSRRVVNSIMPIDT